MHSRRYSAFISYRHADNTQEGRRWAEWLHRALERYVVPPDLIGIPNLRGDPIRDSLYPIFRDEDELPANADLATGIRAALEVSDHLIVLCSPRSAVSPWVRKEVREFKELGRSDRILAIIIAGEPNADDPAKAREGILRDEECFCEELRFGAVRDDGTLDWTIRTEPLAADLRPIGTRAEGFVTAEAYREYLTLNSSLTPEKIAIRTEAYRQQLDHALIKVIAGLLGVPLGQLKDRDAAHRTALAEAEAAKQREIAERERQLAEHAQRSADEAHRARQATEHTARRLAIAGAGASALALLAGWFWWEAGKEKAEADIQRAAAQTQTEKTKAALVESNRQLERSQVEEGRAWLERGRAAKNNGENPQALLLAGRALGYAGYGRRDKEPPDFATSYQPLLSTAMKDEVAEKHRAEEADQTATFLYSIRTTLLPLWGGRMKDSVACVAFSPDGTRLASGSEDNTIKLWDAATGREFASLQGHTKSVTSVAFSHDGRCLASASDDGTIKLWDTASGKEIASLQVHMDIVTSVAFSPDDSRLAGAIYGAIKLWDAATGKEVASLQGHNRDVTSVAFSPDGNRLASGSDDNAIKLWEAATGKELTSLQGHKKSVTSVAFNHDGSRLASASDDETIKLWDTASGKEIASLHGHTNIVNTIVFSPEGSHLASGSIDDTIKLWDTAIGKELATIHGHKDAVYGVAFSPDGSRLVSGSDDKTIKLWDAATHEQFGSFKGHTSLVWSTAFTLDGSRLASGSVDKTIKIWDTATGKELATFQGHTKEVGAVSFSLDGKLLASGSYDKTIKLWDTRTGKEVASLQGHTNNVKIVAFCPDGSRLASGSDDKTIMVWDTTTGKELASLHGHEDLLSVAFSPDGNCLATFSAGKSRRLWDVTTGKELDQPTAQRLEEAERWRAANGERLDSVDPIYASEIYDEAIYLVSYSSPLDLTAPIRAGLAAFKDREVVFPEVTATTPMIHYRQDTLAQLADPKLTPERRAELRMELCTKSSQFRAATVLWQRLLQGEWPGFEGATVPKDQAPATIPADSPIRRLYLLALIDATKHPQIHGHPTICQTAAQIVPVLTMEMMATPTISLAMMSLMQTLAKDDSPDMSAPRAALMKRLDEVATKDWLAVLREGK